MVTVEGCISSSLSRGPLLAVPLPPGRSYEGNGAWQRCRTSLAEAREKAANLHRTVKGGTDPLAERAARAAAEKAAAHQATVRALTFSDVADRYLAAHQESWRNPKHRQQWRDTLAASAAPILGSLSVADVDTGAVMRVLEPVWRKKTETASRLRGRIEAVLDYATARAGALGRTRLDGGDTWTTCYRRAARSPR